MSIQVLEPPTVNRTRIVPSNPLLADPTRSATLRRVWVGDFWSRFQRLKGKINRLVIDEDVFGLFDTQNQERNNGQRNSLGSQEPGRASDGTGETNGGTDSAQARGDSRGGSPSAERDAGRSAEGIGRLRPDDVRQRLVVNVGRWAAKNSAAKAKAFNNWLQTQIQVDVMAGATAASVEDAYWKKYSDEAYKKGAGRAFDDVKKPAVFSGKEGAFFNGTKQQFLQQSFGRPVAIRKLKRMAGRVFTDLKNVTDDMSKDMTKVLTDGLAQGKNPHVIAKELNERVSKIGQHRATLIARTEITRVHAEGQLDALEEMGVKEVGVMVEWSTAGDDRVCPLCQPLEGVVLTVKEARGIIPRHPQCRCAHIPANVGESTKGQTRSKGALQTSQDKSIKAEIPKKASKRTIAQQKAMSPWKGADTKFRKKRPKSVLDAPIESKLGTKPTIPAQPPVGLPRKAKPIPKPAKTVKAAPKEPAKIVSKVTPKPKPITPKPKVEPKSIRAKTPQEWEASWSAEERSVMSRWTTGDPNLDSFGPDYHVLLKEAMAGNPANESLAADAKTFLKMLERSPNRSGTMHRGLGGLKNKDSIQGIGKLDVGKEFRWNVPSSSTKNLDVIEDFMLDYTEGGQTAIRFDIQAKTGVDISGLKTAGEYAEYEAEVLLRPGVKYRVTDVRVGKAISNLDDEEIELVRVVLEEL